MIVYSTTDLSDLLSLKNKCTQIHSSEDLLKFLVDLTEHISAITTQLNLITTDHNLLSQQVNTLEENHILTQDLIAKLRASTKKPNIYKTIPINSDNTVPLTDMQTDLTLITQTDYCTEYTIGEENGKD